MPSKDKLLKTVKLNITKDIYDTIMYGLNWTRCPEGAQYWSHVYGNLGRIWIDARMKKNEKKSSAGNQGKDK